MAKKPATDPKAKRGKAKFKEMFQELATIQEEIVHRPHSQPTRLPHRPLPEDSEEEVELDILQHQSSNLDSICEAVHRLIAKNKVSAKNAFDVPLIDLEQLPDFADSLENQYAWKRLSSTLESDYKIYGYRVDAIHSITYGILHAMARRQQDPQLPVAPPVNAPLPQQPHLKLHEPAEAEHLERKIQNLNLTAVELSVGVDPILERRKRQFDQLGPTTMLLNTLSCDEHLALELVNKGSQPFRYPQWGDYSGPWSVTDPLMALTQLQTFRSSCEQQIWGRMKGEDMEEWFGQNQNYFSGNWDQTSNGNGKRAISKEIKLRSKMMAEDYEEEEQWIADQKFMGIRIHGKAETVKVETKEEDVSNYVDFSLREFDEDTRDSVFRKESDKNEFHEEVEDRFLVAPPPRSAFSPATNLLTLRATPALPDFYVPVEAQVDVRRQQVSILEAKRRMKDLMHERSTFRTLYQGYGETEEISPALCFLTVLHLANQYGLTLKQIDDGNFRIQ